MTIKYLSGQMTLGQRIRAACRRHREVYMGSEAGVIHRYYKSGQPMPPHAKASEHWSGRSDIVTCVECLQNG